MPKLVPVLVWSQQPKRLYKVGQTPAAVFLNFADGSSVKMSRRKYGRAADAVFVKAQALVGKDVVYQTSQTTANWSPSEWFSDVKEAV